MTLTLFITLFTYQDVQLNFQFPIIDKTLKQNIINYLHLNAIIQKQSQRGYSTVLNLNTFYREIQLRCNSIVCFKVRIILLFTQCLMYIQQNSVTRDNYRSQAEARDNEICRKRRIRRLNHNHSISRRRITTRRELSLAKMSETK